MERAGDATSASKYALPTDAGLTSLGLIMQLGGGLFLAIDVLLILTSVVVQLNLPMLVFGVLGIARSAIHIGAGGRLARSEPGAVAAARRYVWVAVAHSAIALGVMALEARAALRGGMLLYFALLLLAWPTVVFIVLRRPALRGEELVAPRDLGAEGAGVLMTAMGIMGTVFAIAILVALLSADMPQSRGADLMYPVMLLLLGTLTLRAVLHARAGIRLLRHGLRGDILSVDVRRYFAVAVTSAALFMALVMFSGAVSIVAVLFGVAVIALLLVWPLVVRNYVEQIELFDQLGGLIRRNPMLLAVPLSGVAAVLVLPVLAVVLALRPPPPDPSDTWRDVF